MRSAPRASTGTSLQRRNVEAIAAIEAAVMGERSPGDRTARGLIRLLGRPVSVVIHALVFVGWIVWNGGFVPDLPIFDPRPFNLLALAASVEAILLGLLILAAQNRIQHEEERRAHLHLQIAMLAETESTRMLQMLAQLCAREGLHPTYPDALDELTAETDPVAIVETIKSTMPAEE